MFLMVGGVAQWSEGSVTKLKRFYDAIFDDGFGLKKGRPFLRTQ